MIEQRTAFNLTAANIWGKVSNRMHTQSSEFSENFHCPSEAAGAPLVATAFRVPCGGFMSANVSKAEGYSEENPVILVQGTDICGKRFEKEINIRDIDPRNASFIELLAFEGYSAANGIPSQAARIAARSVMMQELNGKEFPEFNAFTRTDFVSAYNELKESLHATNNYETLLWVNANVEHFYNHFNVEK